MKISVIILDFLKADMVVKNVKSILKQKGDFKIEIIVVDNSCDEKNAKKLKKLEFYEDVRILVQKTNIGYTRGNNIGVKKAKGDFIFIINPDILLKNEDIFQKMLNFIKKNPDIGIIGPKQENENGTIQITSRKFPNIFTQIIRRSLFRYFPILKNIVFEDELRYCDMDLISEADWLQSSFLLIKKDFWNEIGGFDENYFIFMADSKICFESWKRGKKVIYFPEVKVYADGKRASEGGIVDFFKKGILRQHFKDSLKYFFKHLFESNPRKKYYLKKNNNLV